jgi:hypothetical protein
VNTDLQFPATVLEMKRAGERWRAASDPDHREPVKEVRTMADISPYTDSARLRNPACGGA